MTKANGKFTKLVAIEAKARKVWYGLRPHGGKPESLRERVALRDLERAKLALVIATGASDFTEAKGLAGYDPQYAPRFARGTRRASPQSRKAASGKAKGKATARGDAMREAVAASLGAGGYAMSDAEAANEADGIA